MWENFQVFNENISEQFDLSNKKCKKYQKKLTQKRLRNIALYYLKRFETSCENLRSVLQKRIDKYVYENPEFNRNEAIKWVDEIINDFIRLHYLDDYRYAEMKIKSYLQTGKPERYIKIKLKEKGISESIITDIMCEQDYNPLEMALKLAKKKKIGPYRCIENSKEFLKKDMGVLIRAGFDYEIVRQVLNYEFIDDDTDDDL